MLELKAAQFSQKLHSFHCKSDIFQNSPKTHQIFGQLLSGKFVTLYFQKSANLVTLHGIEISYLWCEGSKRWRYHPADPNSSAWARLIRSCPQMSWKRLNLLTNKKNRSRCHNLILKIGHSRPLFLLFSVFFNKHKFNFYNKLMRKNVNPHP